MRKTYWDQDGMKRRPAHQNRQMRAGRQWPSQAVYEVHEPVLWRKDRTITGMRFRGAFARL
jgi:hypothetical protein